MCVENTNDCYITNGPAKIVKYSTNILQDYIETTNKYMNEIFYLTFRTEVPFYFLV